MKTSNTNAAPSQSGLQGGIPHSGYVPPVVRAGVPLRVWVTVRFAAAAVLAVVGALLLSYDSDKWVGLVPVAGAALSFWLGWAAIAGARSSSPRI